MKFLKAHPRLHAMQAALAALAIFALQSVGAQQSDDVSRSSPDGQITAESLAARYPMGSIQSVETADQALAAVEQARAAAGARYATEVQACATKFFATACSDEAKERQRNALAKISPVELEALMFNRKARVIERDKALAEKRAKEEADAPERLRTQQENEKQAAEKAATVQRKSQEKTDEENRLSGTVSTRQQAHEEKMRRLQEEELRKAPERERNIAAYQRKVKEAEEHQRAIAERKSKKDAERAANAATKSQ
jgi:hypothetical protein